MPIYEYECSLCHFQFEHKQSFDDDPMSLCPLCRGKARRVLRSVPVIFKGDGFYITDNRKDGGKEGSFGGEQKESKLEGTAAGEGA